MSNRQHPALPLGNGPVTLPELAEQKQRGEKIVMVTAYDAPSARLADQAGSTSSSSGDSAANDRPGLRVDAPSDHAWTRWSCSPARRDARRARASRRRRHAVRLVSRSPTRTPSATPSGSSRRRAPTASSSRAPAATLDASARDRRRRDPGDGPHRPHAAVGHHARRLQGPGPDAAKAALRLYDDALALEAAGCFAIVLEAVPARVAAARSPQRCGSRRSGSAPARPATARCSSGTTCSASTRGRTPRFVKQYAQLAEEIRSALERVRRATCASARFPARRAHLHDAGRGARGVPGGARLGRRGAGYRNVRNTAPATNRAAASAYATTARGQLTPRITRMPRSTSPAAHR